MPISSHLPPTLWLPACSASSGGCMSPRNRYAADARTSLCRTLRAAVAAAAASPPVIASHCPAIGFSVAPQAFRSYAGRRSEPQALRRPGAGRGPRGAAPVRGGAQLCGGGAAGDLGQAVSCGSDPRHCRSAAGVLHAALWTVSRWIHRNCDRALADTLLAMAARRSPAPPPGRRPTNASSLLLHAASSCCTASTRLCWARCSPGARPRGPATWASRCSAADARGGSVQARAAAAPAPSSPQTPPPAPRCPSPGLWRRPEDAVAVPP